MMKSPVNQMSPAKQFLLFMAVFLGIFATCNLLGLGVIAGIYGMNVLYDIGHGTFNLPQSITAFYVLQIIAMTLPIFASPIVFSKWVIKNTPGYIKANSRFSYLLLVIVFFIMMISTPLIEVLSNLNQRLILPDWLRWLEEWMKSSEESAQRITAVILKMNTVWDLIKNVLLLGVLTAIAEEFMFRGVLQTIFNKWTKNAHISIWITAALFSAFHIEFYGFLPRMLIGGLLGYLVAYSGSIWPAVWGHFLNNSTIVVVTYLYQKKIVALNPDDTHIFSYPAYLFSTLIIIILLIVYKKVAQGRQKPLLNGEKLG